MSKKVSVIICTYNAEDELKECLPSLENQDYSEKELIVVNDASTDGTLDFLEHFKSQSDTQTLIVTNKTNLGVAGSRNVGIQNATGEIIAFTDADCIADSRWISELVKGYGQKDVKAVGGKIFDYRSTNLWELSNKGYNYVASKEGYVSYIQGCNMSFDSKVLRRFMFNDEIKYGYEETLLCDYLIEKGYKIYYRPEAIVNHKHKSGLFAILKQKYSRGLSSVWYRKKQKKFIMLKRHFVLFAAFLIIPFSLTNKLFIYLFFGLLCLFVLSLLHDEITLKRKNVKEVVVTFPFLILIELFHFYGSVAGLAKFRLFKKIVI